MNLNTEQRNAVNSKAEVSIVLAGPGSGKTRVLIARVLHLIALDADPAKIVVITYTNAGAKEIMQRLPKEAASALGYVGTLHGWCLRLLQQCGANLGYRKGRAITILREEDREALLQRVRDGLGYAKVSMKEIAAGVTPRAKQIALEYRSRMKRENMIDFDKILEDGLRLMQSKGVLALPELEHLLVDEFQDSAAIDYQIIVHGAQPTKSLFIVGDSDQSIFGFRGANPAQFTALANGHAPLGWVFQLEKNYRSDIAICEAANRLIAHNTQRIPKMIAPTSEESGDVIVDRYDSAREENHGIGVMIKTLLSHCEAPSEIAVLALTNEIVTGIRETLVSMGIPVAQKRAEKLPHDWSFCLTTIQLMMDRQNNLLAEAYLRGVGYSLPGINTLIMKSMKTGRPIFDLSDAFVWDSGFPWRWDCEILPRMLTEARVGAESVALVTQRIAALPQAFPTLPDLLSDLFRHEDWKEEAKVDGVVVSTIHGAKGREWDTVFVAGCEEGILPRLTKTADIEEERRLMFVAVTRARHRLILSHCSLRWSFGRRLEQSPSRFIAEMKIP